MVDDTEPMRPRGILSESDRRYLADPEGYKSRQARHKRQEEIPQRIRNAFLDMSILADPEIDSELLDEAFRDQEGETVKVGEVVAAWRDRDPEVKERLVMDDDIMQAFIDTVALIANVAHWTDYQGIIEEGTKTAVERFSDEYVVVDASYRPEIKRPDDAKKRAESHLEKEISLTDEEAILLLEEGDVDPEKVAANIRERNERRQEHRDLSFEESYDEYAEQLGAEIDVDEE